MGQFVRKSQTKKNFRDLGDKSEAYYGQKVHQLGMALLVSPLCLRQRNLGQVDAAVLVNDSIYLFEIKSRKWANVYEGQDWISQRQRRRLMDSAKWLGQIFNRPARLRPLMVFRSK